jgi:ATP-binding cassette subfamily C protein
MVRFWDARSGSIHFGGVSLKELPTKTLRGKTSLLSQETYIFNTTILENILIGKKSADETEVIEAAKMASVHDFIMELKDGYQTKAGELGGRFSAGERQRIGLARMFLHDSSLLLLDEPTSNIDALNERVVLRSISEGKRGKTVVIASHRKSALTIADSLYRMEGGKLRAVDVLKAE